MSSTIKPIHIHGHASGPNPWKVAIILEELQIPYEWEMMDMGEIKKPPFEKINPNGRVPVIIDPNTNITLWESGAIIEYLVETYDKANTLTYTTFPEKYHLKQWLHFQMSGQGPYFGQAAWFNVLMPEKVPQAQKRYKDQLVRVFDVLNRALEGKEYLVGDKCTYADLAFVTWDAIVPWIFGDEYKELNIENNYPNFFAWNKRVTARPAVKKVLADRQAAMSAGH